MSIADSGRLPSTSCSSGAPSPDRTPFHVDILPTTPPPNLAQSSARSLSLQSTRPNEGSGSRKEHIGRVTKAAIEPGVAHDMKDPQRCNPVDMVRFLLALCCVGNSSDVPCDVQALHGRLGDCWEKVVPVANSGEMRRRLEAYKSSSSKAENNMYGPLSNALNYGLEELSKVEVPGLPEFQNHIVFIPLDEGVTSDRNQEGSLFKPDVILVPFTTACDFHKFKDTRSLKVSQFVSKIPKKTPSRMGPPETAPTKKPAKKAPPKATPKKLSPRVPPSDHIGWKDILSVVELKRGPKQHWPKLGNFIDMVPVITHEDSDEGLFEPRTPDPETSSDVSLSRTLVTSKTSGSKRSATDAGITSGAPRMNTKRQWQPPKQSLLTQTGTYAGEKLSDSHSISHVLNLLVQDDSLWISWIDRAGAIISSQFSLFEHLPLVLVLLLILQRFGRRQWGEISELTAAGHSVSLHPVNVDGKLGKDEVGVNFYPDDKVHSGWSLLGRATAVVGANTERDRCDVARMEGYLESQDKMEDDTTESMVDGKPDGVDPSNTAGREDGTRSAFNQTRDAYRKACDDVIKAHNLILKISWPETSRIPEWEIVARAQILGKTDKFIRGHIPEVKYGRNFDRYSTQHIRSFLGLQHDERTGTRTLRLVVMDRLRPIHDLEGEQLWDVFWQCFICHHRLWVHGIHHGDVSLNNLMYGFSATGEPEGVLNDYDLASWKEFPTTNTDRTGTIPFLALDMLKGGLSGQIPRLYRHDAESFIWVLVYITLVKVEYKGYTVEISQPSSVKPWFEGGIQIHLLSKQACFFNYGYDFPVSKPYERYITTIGSLMEYWVQLSATLSRTRRAGSTEPETDNPKDALKNLIKAVGKSLDADTQKEFGKVKTLLLEAIEAPTVV